MNLSNHILIVDDEPSIRLTLAETLINDGYQVEAVESGEAALAHGAIQEFDLALVDLQLKGMQGTELLTALRQQAPDMVVIMLTAHASLESAVEALRQGAHDYLFKPCPTVELRESIHRGLISRQQKRQQRELLHQLEQHMANHLANLRAAIGEQASAAASWLAAQQSATAPPYIVQPAEEPGRFLQYGGLMTDSMRHIITMDGHLLELSPTEFNLLAYLMSEAPRVVPPQELIRQVQGYDSAPWEASETVRSHIYHIRQKLKKASGRSNIIRTVRGVGYTLDDPAP